MTTPGLSPHAGLWDCRDIQSTSCTAEASTDISRENAIHASGTQAIMEQVLIASVQRSEMYYES